MSDHARHVHPRKLYAMLRDCPDARARAEAALDSLRNITGADSGMLLLVRGGELVVCANSTSEEPSDALMERARSMWVKESDYQSDSDTTRTVDVSHLLTASDAEESPIWRLAEDANYEPRLLSVYHKSAWTPVGMAVLKTRSGRSLLPIRRAHVEAVCNAFIDTGDVPAAN